MNDSTIDMTAAIIAFLTPLYEQCGSDFKTIQEFAEDGFFNQGGEINIKLPKWLEKELGVAEEMPPMEFEGIEV